MTNLQQNLEQRDAGLSPVALKRLWLWGPIALGSLIGGVLLLSLALPRGMTIQSDLRRLEDLEVQRQERDLLKRQAQKMARERKLAERQQQDLVRLVTGKGDPATFLATLDLEAEAAKVKLRLFEPVAAAPAAQPPGGGAPPPPGGGAPPPAPPGQAAPGAPGPGGAPGAPGTPAEAEAAAADPLRQAGLRQRSLVLTASGTYPQLLDFLRRMERLEVLVEQKDLTLTQAGIGPDRTPQNPEDPLPTPYVPEVEVKLNITLYNKVPKEPEPEPKTPAPKPAGGPG
jgi:type IV pilus assembly protein PilO